MNNECQQCGRPLDVNPRFEPDAVLCPGCAEEMGLNTDGSEKEDED